jgi:hypothetical protein
VSVPLGRSRGISVTRLSEERLGSLSPPRLSSLNFSRQRVEGLFSRKQFQRKPSVRTTIGPPSRIAASDAAARQGRCAPHLIRLQLGIANDTPHRLDIARALLMTESPRRWPSLPTSPIGKHVSLRRSWQASARSSDSRSRPSHRRSWASLTPLAALFLRGAACVQRYPLRVQQQGPPSLKQVRC